MKAGRLAAALDCLDGGRPEHDGVLVGATVASRRQPDPEPALVVAIVLGGSGGISVCSPPRWPQVLEERARHGIERRPPEVHRPGCKDLGATYCSRKRHLGRAPGAVEVGNPGQQDRPGWGEAASRVDLDSAATEGVSVRKACPGEKRRSSPVRHDDVGAEGKSAAAGDEPHSDEAFLRSAQIAREVDEMEAASDAVDPAKEVIGREEGEVAGQVAKAFAGVVGMPRDDLDWPGKMIRRYRCRREWASGMFSKSVSEKKLAAGPCDRASEETESYGRGCDGMSWSRCGRARLLCAHVPSDTRSRPSRFRLRP